MHDDDGEREGTDGTGLRGAGPRRDRPRGGSIAPDGGAAAEQGRLFQHPLTIAGAVVGAGAVVVVLLGAGAVAGGDPVGWLGVVVGVVGAVVAYGLTRAAVVREDAGLDPDVVRRIGSADDAGQSSHVRVLP